MNRVNHLASATPSLSVSIPPFLKLIPGTPDSSNSYLTHKEPGEITLSMNTFTTKMKDVLNIDDNI
jgi:hypothetical protein